MKKWEKNIRRTVPYVPGEQPKEENIIKLNTNENPYPPVRGALSAHLRLEFEKMRLYPDPEARELVEALEKYYGLGGGQMVDTMKRELMVHRISPTHLITATIRRSMWRTPPLSAHKLP